MRVLIQTFLRLPPEARLLALMLAILLPLAALGLILPMQIIGWAAGGVVAMFAVLFVVLLYYRLSASAQGRRLDQEISAQLGGPTRRELAEKDREFRQKWLDGIAKLKRARISLYDLPWYILIGEPGGGKTMTLLNSGMDFPMGKDELPGFGGTRNYNWWFTNTAVILDTAGRLVFEQEGTTDRHEWEAFLKLLQRRRRCPINGVVVALPADKLMADSAEQRDRSASVIRERLRQIQSILDVRFPVFLLVTKADLIAGFTEFFNELDSLQRNQLFGWSHAGEFDRAYDPAEFGAEFDGLYRRLHELRLQFLARRASDVELGWVYTYPEAFASLKDRVQDYIDVLFSRNIFAEALFFRGFYFTSSLQEGKPFLEIIGQHFGSERLDNLEGIFPQSRAFFIHDFYTRKVSREQGMVFRSQKHINRMRFLQRSTLLVGLPMFILLCGLTALGYYAYSRTVQEPMATLDSAATLINKYKSAPPGGLEGGADDARRTAEIIRTLDQTITQLRTPSGLAALVFPSIGVDAERHLRSLQRELIGHCILRPEMHRVEQALAGAAVPLTLENIQDFQTSLETYLLWHTGQGGGSLADLRRVLGPSRADMPQVTEDLQRFSAVMGGSLVAGLAQDTAQRRQVLDRALQRAQDYWLSTTDLMAHPDFKWWQVLLSRCEEVRARYRELLDGAAAFDNARSSAELRGVTTAWLAHFPGAESPDAPAPSASATLLLQAVREHLRGAPRRADGGTLVTPQELIADNSQKAAAFWEGLLQRLPAHNAQVSDEVSAEAAALRERIRGYRQVLERQAATATNDVVTRLGNLRSVLEPRPPRAPVEYEFVESAQQAERILHDQVASALANTAQVRLDSLARWTEALNRLLLEPAPDSAFQLEAEWDTPALRRLVETVARARRRFTGEMIVEDIAQQLSEQSDAGLAEWMDGHGEDSRAALLRFPGLLNRHAQTFLSSTLAARQDLEEALAAAAQRGLIREHSDLQRLLADATRAYVHHYLTAWSNVYSDFRLDSVERFSFDKPASWEEYRNWIRNHGGDIKRQYTDYLDALLEHAVGPFLGTHGAQLAPDLARMNWPRDGRLQSVFTRLVESGALPDVRPIVQQWNRFEDDSADFRLARIDDLGRAQILFPGLGDTAGGGLLAGEWLTQQVQYVIDFGDWRLWADIQDLLLATLARFQKDPPMVFEGGDAADVDAVALTRALEEIDAIRAFEHTQEPDRTPRAEAAQRRAWLERAGAWRTFLERDAYTVEISCQQPAADSGRRGTADLYRQVVLSVPGMSPPDGRSQDKITFEASGAQPQRVTWKPQAGILVVGLFGQTEALSGRNAPMAPQVLELPRSHYPLLDLILKRGVRGPEGWLIELDRNLAEIPGLNGTSIEPPTRWIVLRLAFIEPEGGIPEPLAWPRASGQETRPSAPWRE